MMHRDVTEINYVTHGNIVTYLEERRNSKVLVFPVAGPASCVAAGLHPRQKNHPCITVQGFPRLTACDVPGDSEVNCIF